jgi:hypothetical protein
MTRLPLVACLLLATPLCASGYVEAPPLSSVMTSFTACVAELEARARNDLVAAAAPPLADQTITLVTDGVHQEGNSAQYQSKLWYHNSRSDLERGLKVTSHSYTRVVMTCTGATLSVINGQGYTLDTFE